MMIRGAAVKSLLPFTSLPVFGEGPGWGLSARTELVEAPRPTLPEDGEGSNYRHSSANCIATTRS